MNWVHPQRFNDSNVSLSQQQTKNYLKCDSFTSIKCVNYCANEKTYRNHKRRIWEVKLKVTSNLQRKDDKEKWNCEFCFLIIENLHNFSSFQCQKGFFVSSTVKICLLWKLANSRWLRNIAKCAKLRITDKNVDWWLTGHRG